jgi:hypothetical protein
MAPAPESSSSVSVNLPTGAGEACSGAGCLVFNVLVIVIMLIIVGIIFAYAIYKKWRLSRAIKRGGIPAKFLISQLAVPPSERGDLKAFSFPVHRPKTREEINEESCPICLATKPKASSWIVFGACTHATCTSCFKKLVGEKKLLAACPICRTMLAKGEGKRGGPTTTPATELPATTTSETTITTTTTTSIEEAPLPPSDNNV